jgi:hypothetical protein
LLEGPFSFQETVSPPAMVDVRQEAKFTSNRKESAAPPSAPRL